MNLPLAQASTIPEDSGGPYVVAAYVVFIVILVVYLAIMAQRLRKVSKQADELEQRIAELALDTDAEPEPIAAKVQA